MSKLPRALLTGGYSVAVHLPLQPGRTAHRYTTETRKNVGRVRGSNQPVEISVPVAACDPKGPAAVLFSAAWADQHGAQACTEKACFPDA